MRIQGERADEALPGAQGRVLFAYLCLNRTRVVSREEAMEAIWDDAPPSAPNVALNALISKLRRALGAERVQGKGGLRISLPADALVDVESAIAALHRSQTACSAGHWAGAWGPGHVILERGFMPGHEGRWIAETREQLEHLRVDALECAVTAKLGIGGFELGPGERLARELVAVAPYRESGHVLLMRTLAARGNVAEALRAYDELRVRLRDELGIAPGPEAQEVHRSLLAQV